MLIDTHAHLNFQVFEKDFGKVLKQSQEAGVTKIINVGTDFDSSQKAVKLTQKNNCLWASVGIHPHHTEKYLNLNEISKKLEKLSKNPKVVAIGECGLDYHPGKNGQISDPEKQKKLFLLQLKLSQNLALPVIIHCRDAHDDILKVLSLFGNPSSLKGVFHCFSGNEAFLKKVLALGFYIGFDGNLTFKNAKSLQKIAQEAPLKRILLETDSPYLSPEPKRGLRNMPANVKIIATFLAQLKETSFENIAKITSQNAKKVFLKI